MNTFMFPGQGSQKMKWEKSFMKIFPLLKMYLKKLMIVLKQN